ncbi:MAG TPA: hypothetical protein PK537_11590 [Candidatus Limiplasma sp.]|nr:hypothetical protein [Candidatus Limiplasma sp.]
MDRIRYAMQNMMVGRNGPDRLAYMMMWVGIGLLILAMIFNSMIINVLALAVYVLAMFRIFSKNISKRSAENKWYLNQSNQLRTSLKHQRNRMKLRKEYRYFKCPQCKAWLRVPRGSGKVKVTCGQCGNQFSYIAKK